MLNQKLFHISQGTKGWLPTVKSDIKVGELLTRGFTLVEGRLYPDQIHEIEALLPLRYNAKDVTPYKSDIINHGDLCCRMIKITRIPLLESYRKVQVKADSIAHFVEEYGKPSQFSTRGKEHLAREIERLTMELAEKGYALISACDSKSGKVVAYIA
ncbi:hypothetical protein KGP17_27595 (plasmid) [Serratia sp. JSRIV001]|uniref:hypothetical protein n=1 Tax=Serratia TaxID=613 RepID=UPI001CBD50F8|nr:MULTISPECIES: hypothetical protein [unclassified Serratia (in: enterobacteria)]UAN48782.1 hypothetical protein KGP17_27595 [Serratia sp. JSRIV001]UAN54467.1 hypothetical protein KGP26_28790 [Serratia sp. JSRIV002]UAN60580.1 hypothetical protein KGP21_29005 [Serratia sp. JSRIV004]